MKTLQLKNLVAPKSYSSSMTITQGVVNKVIHVANDHNPNIPIDGYYFSARDCGQDMALVFWFGVGESWWDSKSLRVVK